jgi:hypothetical protein
MKQGASIGFGRAAARRAKDRDRDLAHLFRADLKHYPGLTWARESADFKMAC